MVCAEQTLSMAIESSCPMLLFDNLLQIKTITLAPKLFTWGHSLHVPGAEFVYRLCVHSLSPQEVHTSEMSIHSHLIYSYDNMHTLCIVIQ